MTYVRNNKQFKSKIKKDDYVENIVPIKTKYGTYLVGHKFMVSETDPFYFFPSFGYVEIFSLQNSSPEGIIPQEDCFLIVQKKNLKKINS